MASFEPEPTENGSRKRALSPGLYVVATPIGNLEDITLRALRVLKQADLIACEDTRQTQKILNHYAIATPTISYQEHNEMTRAPQLVVELERGARIALVTDAGMPGISDPGFRLITLAIRHNLPVVPIPGPAAFVAALAACGLPTDAFDFRGFLPPRRGQRRALLESLRHDPRTQVFYEAPHRLPDSLLDIVGILGPERRVVIARELTKIHEEFLRGRADEVSAAVRARGPIKGEITLLFAGAEKTNKITHDPGSPRPDIRQRFEDLRRHNDLNEKAALKKLAKEMGISRSQAYRELQTRK
jgi:16S rRNA (cytidine1402-2'-O)-methyltransferase